MMSDSMTLTIALGLTCSLFFGCMWTALDKLRDRVHALEVFKDLVVDIAEEYLNKSTTESE